MNFADNYRAEAGDLLADLEVALLELESDPNCPRFPRPAHH
jgi:hypothetical protein